MIIILKTRNKNQLLIKAFSGLSLILMFWLYYGHMSTKFQEQNNQLVTKLDQTITKKKQDKS
ncbi:MAG: hypothetical protein WBG69_07530, partial [Arcobacteraceae bacterium]